MTGLRIGIMIGMAALCLAAPAAIPPARADAALCDGAARTASAATGVPAWVLHTITRVETGRGPVSDPASDPVTWPWATNIDGTGAWHPDRATAAAAVAAALASGRRSVDIGCFQLNHRWHGAHFASAQAMLDPEANAAHAARFLARLHGEFGNWDDAVAAYHSRTPALGQRYLSRFRRIAACRTATGCHWDPPRPAAPPDRALATTRRPALADRARPLIWQGHPRAGVITP